MSGHRSAHDLVHFDYNLNPCKVLKVERTEFISLALFRCSLPMALILRLTSRRPLRLSRRLSPILFSEARTSSIVAGGW